MPDIMINGMRVSVHGKDDDLAVQSQLFWDWVKKLDDDLVFSSIEFQSVDLRNRLKPEDGTLFIKLKAIVTDKQGRPLPGIVFLRGGSVAVLILIHCNGKTYLALVSQARVPIGQPSFLEIPAGMLDGEKNIKGVVVQELEQELGLKISESQTGLYALWDVPFYTSPGILDEAVHFYAADFFVDEEFIKNFHGQKRSSAGEHEHIVVHLIEPHEIYEKTSDMKTWIAYQLYIKKHYGK